MYYTKSVFKICILLGAEVITMIKSIVAENAKRIIEHRGLKQRVVTERAGFSIQQFSALLNHRKVMKDTDVVAIARALEVTPNDLFNDTGQSSA